MRIGLDFDGTVALYDEAFHRCAVEQFQMPREITANKLAIRTWFWRTPEGKQKWIELQGVVYGTRMSEAGVAPGLVRFLQMCREKEICVSIISHKTEFPVIGPRVNLREAALRWLEQRGFNDKPGFRREEVFFESTREEKIRRIVTQRCSHFVDDLEEVFMEPAFPANVERLLFAPGAKDDLSRDLKVFSSWDSIRDYFLNATA
jgi:hypothetical protein